MRRQVPKKKEEEQNLGRKESILERERESEEGEEEEGKEKWEAGLKRGGPDGHVTWKFTSDGWLTRGNPETGGRTWEGGLVHRDP